MDKKSVSLPDVSPLIATLHHFAKLDWLIEDSGLFYQQS